MLSFNNNDTLSPLVSPPDPKTPLPSIASVPSPHPSTSSNSSSSSFLVSICNTLLAIIIGIPLGIIYGILKFLITILIALLFRFPLRSYHLFKITICQYQPSSSSLDLFSDNKYAPLLRFLVSCFIIPYELCHFLYVVIYHATIGISLVMIQTTMRMQCGEWSGMADDVKGNCRCAEDSFLGVLAARQRELLSLSSSDDEEREWVYTTVDALKFVSAVIPGALIGLGIPMVPFVLAIGGITMYRLPINVYKTTKAIVVTVMLRWDVKILALVLLPLVHFIVFPLGVTLVAVFWSVVHFPYHTTRNIYRGSRLTKNWDFRQVLKEYYYAHVEYITEHCDNYIHPTGVPLDWDGTVYVIPVAGLGHCVVEAIIIHILTFVGLIVCCGGSALLCAIKFLPGCCYGWYVIREDYQPEQPPGRCARYTIVPLVLFVGVILRSFGIAILFVLYILIGTGMAVRVPWEYVTNGCRAGWYEPLRILKDIDNCTGWVCGEYQILVCIEDENPYWRDNSKTSRRRSRSRRTSGGGSGGGGDVDVDDDKTLATMDPCLDTPAEAYERAGLYWDRFVSQNIKTAAELVNKRWISYQSIKYAKVDDDDSSSLATIPAAAVLDILADSARATRVKTAAEGEEEEDELLEMEAIKWSIDDSICHEGDRPVHDGITNYLWPMVLDIKSFMCVNRGKLLEDDNLQLLEAIICQKGNNDNNNNENNNTNDNDNDTQSSEDLSTFLRAKRNLRKQNHKLNSQLLKKIYKLVTTISRVKPYRTRMNQIYDCDYRVVMVDNAFKEAAQKAAAAMATASSSSSLYASKMGIPKIQNFIEYEVEDHDDDNSGGQQHHPQTRRGGHAFDDNETNADLKQPLL